MKQISGKELIFFILRIVDNGMTIMIPHDNVAAVGLREVIRKLDVSKVMHMFWPWKIGYTRQTIGLFSDEYLRLPPKVHKNCV